MHPRATLNVFRAALKNQILRPDLSPHYLFKALYIIARRFFNSKAVSFQGNRIYNPLNRVIKVIIHQSFYAIFLCAAPRPLRFIHFHGLLTAEDAKERRVIKVITHLTTITKS